MVTTEGFWVLPIASSWAGGLFWSVWGLLWEGPQEQAGQGLIREEFGEQDGGVLHHQHQQEAELLVPHTTESLYQR